MMQASTSSAPLGRYSVAVIEVISGQSFVQDLGIVVMMPAFTGGPGMSNPHSAELSKAVPEFPVSILAISIAIAVMLYLMRFGRRGGLKFIREIQRIKALQFSDARL